MNKQFRHWPLNEAKAKFSEVVRLAQSEGPQRVTLHGRHVVTVYAADREPGQDKWVGGMALVEAIQACPFKDEYAIVVAGERLPIGEPIDL